MIRLYYVVTAAFAVTLSGAVQLAIANPGAKAPAAAAQPAQPQGEPITGKVLQSMNSGGYSYVLIKREKGDKIWLAVPQAEITVGEQMTFGPGMEMANFESKTLKRTFDKIVFSEGPVKKPAKTEAKEKKSPGSKGAVTAADEKIKVDKASGANSYTVADIYKQKAKLHNKKVAVRGKVIKVSSGIMDRNWIHLQDGSGSAKKGDNDLVVTSKAVPLVGEVVTATGTLQKDKDFGGGYKYQVIMESAEIVVK